MRGLFDTHAPEILGRLENIFLEVVFKVRLIFGVRCKRVSRAINLVSGFMSTPETVMRRSRILRARARVGGGLLEKCFSIAFARARIGNVHPTSIRGASILVSFIVTSTNLWTLIVTSTGVIAAIAFIRVSAITVLILVAKLALAILRTSFRPNVATITVSIRLWSRPSSRLDIVAIPVSLTPTPVTKTTIVSKIYASVVTITNARFIRPRLTIKKGGLLVRKGSP